MGQQWLKCNVSKGMFSNERVIAFNMRGSGLMEYFVPADTVEGQGQDGRVKVRVITHNDGPWAVLPTPYSKTVPVEPTQLVLV